MQHSLKKSILFLLTTPLCLCALGGKPEVIDGLADYEASGNSEIVRMKSEKTILEYNKFNIEEHEFTKFEQPTDKSTLLCRVKGDDPSAIRGKLEANGRLFFVNPNGIFFSKTAQVNVGSIIASTLDIDNKDFLGGRYKFTLSPDAKDSMIANKGRIEAAHNVAFLAPQIVNEGVIMAKAGKIALLGGEVMTLDFDGDEKMQFAIETPLSEGFIEQGGELSSGQVFMRLSTAQQAITSVLNVNGIVEAGHIEIENGVIRLKAGKINAKTLDLEGRALHVQTPLKADKITTHMTGEYVLGDSIQVSNSSLCFDAPVYLNAPEVHLSTGDGGNITFKDQVYARPNALKLSLSAGSGDIKFIKELRVDELNIPSANSVETEKVQVGSWQQHVKGITRLKGESTIERDVALQGYSIDFNKSFTSKGALDLTIPNVNSNQYATITAKSIHQKGNGTASLGGTWVATEGDISFKANVHLLGDVCMDAPHGGIHFQNTIGGVGGLKTTSHHFESKNNIGRIAYLDVKAKDAIRIANVGQGKEGIEGAINLSSEGPIYFTGQDYVASGHNYHSNTSYEFVSDHKTTVYGKSIAPIEFKDAPINIRGLTSLEIKSSQGPVWLREVHGTGSSNFALQAPKNELVVGEVSGIGKMYFSAKSMQLTDEIDVGSVHLIANEPIVVAHNMKAQLGDFIVEAPLIFDTPEIALEAFLGKELRFEGPLSGNTKLSLYAPQGEIILKGELKGNPTRFKKINLHGKKITQHETVVSTGPVHYEADLIQIGHDIITDNTIVLDGPVLLFKNNVIHMSGNKFGRGDIVFNSSLDADKPTRNLVFFNRLSKTQIMGAIGQKGPLGEIAFNSGSVVLHSDVGGANPGVASRMLFDTGNGNIECKASTYHAGEQLWNCGKITFSHEGDVQLKTAGGALSFGPNAKIELDHTKSFAIQTGGGQLNLVQIVSDFAQPIKIQSGSGDAHLHEIGQKVTQLHVEGKNIYLNGHLEAEEIFMEAEKYIEYNHLKEYNTEPTAIQSTGSITLNSNKGSIGTAQRPLKVETPSHLFVGARDVAYLEGVCLDQDPKVYPPNPCPRTFFNGFETKYVFDIVLPDKMNEADLKTLTPELKHNLPTHFMSGVELKPRKAPIYYHEKD